MRSPSASKGLPRVTRANLTNLTALHGETRTYVYLPQPPPL